MQLMTALLLLLIGMSFDVRDVIMTTCLCKCRAAGITMRWAPMSLRSALSEHHWTAPIMLVILYRVLAIIIYRTVAVANAMQLIAGYIAG
jgi:hypothetical protein